ncbi:MAG: DUF480 domain-containing protein [Acidimicrobiia bacterium]
MELSAVAARVLGCLLEKQRTTPDLYPLSLNSLVGACNQTTNRWPVVRYDEATVQAGLDELRELELVRREKPHGGRAIKFSQMLPRVVPMGEPQLALLCVLLLRGPQTPGELKTRTERLHTFVDLGAVDEALAVLVRHEDGPFVDVLPREPSRKEARWCELLSTPNEAGRPTDRAVDAGVAVAGPGDASLAVRVADLETEVARLASVLDGLARETRQ